MYEELVTRCQECCAQHLPEQAGYEVCTTRLSGPIEGVNVHIVRGHFRALISVQRFGRAHAGEHSDASAELRIVATASHAEPVTAEDHERSFAQWSIAGCAMGSVGLGVVGLEYAGLLTAWGQALVVLPLLMAWRLVMVLRIHQDLRARALPPSPVEQARNEAVHAAEGRDRGRWDRLLEQLGQHRDALNQRFAMRPFRSMGALPSGIADRPTLVSPDLRDAS